MHKLLSVFVALISLSVFAFDVEAKRVGGGRNVGTQREAVGQQPKAPAQQQAQNPQQTTPTAPPASGMSRWLGPLAGLAIGAGLASLFFNNGLGGALMGMLMVAAIVIGLVFLVKLLRGGRRTQAPLQYAGANPYGRSEPVAAPPPASPAPAYGGSVAPHSVAATTSGATAQPATTRWPADFNAEEFARHAKHNFVKLQEANDRKDIAAIRDFLTPEMSREIEADMRAAGDAPQTTDVVTLDADVLDVVQENGNYVVSVKFSGLIREAPGADAQPFSETWHLEKPVNGRSGWQVSGIQQA